MSAKVDGRSVGELLLDSEFIARDVLFDGPQLDAASMLRTWGEVVQAAGDVWQALPGRFPNHRNGAGDEAMMQRLQEMTAALHRGIRGKPWPGTGPSDPRLSTIVDNLSRAADLVNAAGVSVPTRADTRADLAAAKARLVHTLYVAAHGVGVALGNRARELRRRPEYTDPKKRVPPGQSLADVLAAQNRLAVFESAAGAYVAGTYPAALAGQHRVEPDSNRLARALASWDIQAHRTLAREPTAANMMLVAQTQAMTAAASRLIMDAAVQTGHLSGLGRPDPAVEAAVVAWVGTARTWADLTPPSQRRPSPELASAAAETRAAFREITSAPSGPASADEMATRAGCPQPIVAIAQSFATGVDLAHLMRDTLDSPQLLGAARVANEILTRAATSREEPSHGSVATLVDPRDIASNRPVAIPEPILDACRAGLDLTIDAARQAMNGSAGCEVAPQAHPRRPGLTGQALDNHRACTSASNDHALLAPHR